MPINPTYPGVYIQEIPSGVRTIMGVSTSVAAFIDYFKYGPMNKAVQILNMGDFEREFGGLDPNSEASYAIQQFYLNGGSEAWVVRTAKGTLERPLKKAQVKILSSIDGSEALSIEAISEGDWGNNLQVKIDYNTDSANLFNIKISEFKNVKGTMSLARSEVFSNLSMDPINPRYVDTVINDEVSGSKLIRASSTGTNLPLQNGTVSGELPDLVKLTASKPAVSVTIGDKGPIEATLDIDSTNPSTLQSLRSSLEKAIRSSKPENPAFAAATVEILQNNLGKYLRILAGLTVESSTVTFSASGTNPTLKELKLDSSSFPIKGIISGDLDSFPSKFTASNPSLEVSVGGITRTITFASPVNLDEARTKLEDAIRAGDAGNPAFENTRVAVYNGKNLIVLAGSLGSDISFAATTADPTTLNQLKLDAESIRSISSVVSGDLTTAFPKLTASSASVNLTIGTEGPHTATCPETPTNFAKAREELEKAIRAAHTNTAFTGAKVALYSSGSERRLIVVIENGGNAVVFTASPLDATTVVELKLDSSYATANIQEYKLGNTAAIPKTAQGAGVTGSNGVPSDGKALIGNLADKTGLYALEDVDLFNILCIPRTSIVSGDNKLSLDEANAVISVAINYCEKRRAFFIVDPPDDVKDAQKVKEWLGETNIRHKNAALYFPRIKVTDPLNEFRLRSFGASGTIAGLYSRTDSNRGVWKAPAGTEATLVNVQALDYTLTDGQNGTLNPLAINCLRNFPVYGNVCWGARTLGGGDQMASEWKYIPVRRLALFIEESLFRGTKWVVFEPNDEPLWAQIRLNIRAFMNSLFHQGAFQGQTPKEAYFVKCDKETTTQDDINKGIVNIVVGFAPLKPAEFVIIQVQQIAGQIQT